MQARRRRFPRRCHRTDGRFDHALCCVEPMPQRNNSSIFAIGQPLTSLLRISARYGLGSMSCSFAVSISEAMQAASKQEHISRDHKKSRARYEPAPDGGGDATGQYDRWAGLLRGSHGP